MLELVIVITGLLLLSAFFSGSEAALLSLTEHEADVIIEKKKFGYQHLRPLKRNMNFAIIAIVVMNNVVNIAGSVWVGQIVSSIFGHGYLGVASGALTLAVIVFSEILPKSTGIHYAEIIAPTVSPLIRALTFILYPIIILLELLNKQFRRGERKVGTEEQIRSLVTIGRRAGHIETDEVQLIHRAFILNDKTAEDIMTPLKDMVSLDITDTLTEASERVKKETLSRFPVFGDSIHDVRGLAMSQDILEALTEGKKDITIQDIMREPLIVSSTVKCDNLLVLFRDKHIHLAVVQKEGKTVGLVTLEDVVEELVGEIEDETDSED